MDVVVLMMKSGLLTLLANVAFFPRSSECESALCSCSKPFSLSAQPTGQPSSSPPNSLISSSSVGFMGVHLGSRSCAGIVTCASSDLHHLGMGKERLVPPQRKIFILLLSQYDWRVAAEQLETEKWAALQF